MSITEARAQAAKVVAEARNHVENFPITEGDAVRVTRLADVIESLLAALPETPTTDDEREAEGWREAEAYADDADPSKRAETADDFMAGWRTADRTRRPSPPTEEQWEYGAIYQADNGIELRWFSMGSGAFTVREAAEHEVARFADAQVVLGRRTKPGPWEPVEAAARVGGELDA